MVERDDELDAECRSLIRNCVVAIMVGVMVLAFAVLLFLCMVSARAEPPPCPASPLAPWLQSLKSPHTGNSCCSVADCRPVRARAAGDHYEAFIDRDTFGPSAPNAWVAVPLEVVLPAIANPVGEPVACFRAGMLLCFVRASET